jgi:hypothetical protein
LMSDGVDLATSRVDVHANSSGIEAGRMRM